jgi:cytoskeletal protein RodZ
MESFWTNVACNVTSEIITWSIFTIGGFIIYLIINMAKRKKAKNSQPAANDRQERPVLEQNSESAENSPVAATEAESTEVSNDEANAPEEPSGAVEISEVEEKETADGRPQTAVEEIAQNAPVPNTRENQCPRCHKVSSEKAVHLGMNRVYPNIERHRIICEHCKQIHFIKKITPQ